MKTYQGEIYAVFYKKFSLFALYEGKDGTNFLPYHVSPKFRPSDLDKNFILGLRAWLVGYELDEGSTNFLFVREIKEGEHVNLICTIVYICENDKDGAVAFVWDGTDAQPISIDSKSYDERLKSKWGRIPLWSFHSLLPLTVVDHEDAPFVTLMDVLTCRKVTEKFKCVVRVVAIYPSQARDFRSPVGIYRVRLSLEDPTARLHALLYAEDAEVMNMRAVLETLHGFSAA